MPVYATEQQLAEWLGLSEPPSGATRALRDASLDVDTLLIGAVYAVDEQGAPTDADTIEALQQATLYQTVHGSPELSGGQALKPGMRTVKIGQISYTAATDPTTGRVVADRYAPRAVDTLRLAGLIPARPVVL